jgi:hypothetical protein
MWAKLRVVERVEFLKMAESKPRLTCVE